MWPVWGPLGTGVSNTALNCPFCVSVWPLIPGASFLFPMILQIGPGPLQPSVRQATWKMDDLIYEYGSLLSVHCKLASQLPL